MTSPAIQTRLLYLVRHAKSDWAYDELSDIDRPLNERGYRDAPALAARLAKLGHTPERLLSSPAVRAISTALIFARQFEHSARDVVLEPRLYEASPAAFLEVLGEQPPSVHKLMVFAHNPALTDVASDLGGVSISNVPTCGIVVVRFEQAPDWASAVSARGRLELFEYPKKPA